jgi:hypothetical protein
MLERSNPGDLIAIKGQIRYKNIIYSPYFKQECIFYYAREFTKVTKGFASRRTANEITDNLRDSNSFLTLTDEGGAIRVKVIGFEHKNFCIHKIKLIKRESSFLRYLGIGSKTEKYREEYIIPPSSQTYYVLGTYTNYHNEYIIAGDIFDKDKSIFTSKTKEAVMREANTLFLKLSLTCLTFSLTIYFLFGRP